MKQYTILADSLTCVKGRKQLLKGQMHPESEFTGSHIDDLVKHGFIEEYAEPAEKPEKAKK